MNIVSVACWWFGTCFIFHNIWNIPSNWLSYFSKWLKPPTTHLQMEVQNAGTSSIGNSCWLVVWNICIIFHILGIIIPTDFHIYQMGTYTTNQKNIAPGRSPPFRYFVEEWNLDALIRYIKVEICGNYGLIILLMMVNGQYHIIVSLLMIMLMLITFNVMVISH